MSAGSPIRWSAVLSAAIRWKSSKSTPSRSAVCFVIADETKPGATQLTLMPKRPSSIASVQVIAWMPAFAAE